MKSLIGCFLILCHFGSAAQQQPGTIPDSSRMAGTTTPKGYASEKRIFTLKSLIVPVALVGYGFVGLHNHNLLQLNHSTKAELREDHPHFLTHVDNYLQFSPAAAVYALNALGIKGRNNTRDRSMIYALSTVMATAVVFPLKKITHVQRPDMSGFNSFPSGHTTIAFASAEFLREEYRDVSPWYGIAGYTVAAANRCFEAFQ